MMRNGGMKRGNTLMRFTVQITAWACLSCRIATAQTVEVWLTTLDQSSKLQQQASVMFESGGNSASNPVIVDESRTYQEVEGFGASFTDSAAYLLNWEATPAARTTALNRLFTRDGSGIGVSFVRNPMGASDLARFHYSYDDDPPGGIDPGLEYFSIAHDQVDIIPLLQEALQLNPQLTIMASPWSPPGWMKDSGSMVGGSLLPSMYSPFANYFVKYIQAYEAEGIPIHYVSLQNEPLYVPGDYPGMGVSAVEQRNILRDYILPAFAASNINTRVLVYDHNWSESYYPETVLADPVIQASAQVAGTAWHGYGGTPGVMQALANQYPDKGNYQTEHSGGLWVGGDANQIVNDFKEITHVMRSSGKAYVKWSLVLDQNHGPNAGGCNTCNPLIFVNTDTGQISYSIDYYTLGHFSKFVLPGAERIYSSNADGVVSAAFSNPDGTKALVTFNDTPIGKTFQVEWGGRSFDYALAGYSGATFTWSGEQSGSFAVSPTNRIQASSFDVVSGLLTESSTDTLGGYNLAYADNNDYAVYRDVDFPAGLTNVSVRVASFGGGTIEFRLNSPTGSLISSLNVPNTGGWQSWQTVQAPVSGVAGLYDLYLVFKGSSGIANVNWFRFEGSVPSGPPGPATQLIWSTQPGLATNGLPFAQQPLLQSADVNGLPSTNGLPAVLDVAVALTAGTGLLLGSTNVNIGTSGWNGAVQFTDLQINGSGSGKVLTASVDTTTNVHSANLLINGDFNNPSSTDPATAWTAEAIGDGWANHENNASVTYDGSYYLVAGASGNGGGRFLQAIPATAGVTYEFSVLSGADTWWLPTGRMTMSFLNEGGSLISSVSRTTVDPAGYGMNFDIAHPWENYSLVAMSPTGTAQIQVELSSNESSVSGYAGTATGSVWFENAALAELVNMPVLTSADTQPFTVSDYVPPPSITNEIAGITMNSDGTYTLEFRGTMGVSYYVQTTTNLLPPVVWEGIVDSSNSVANTNGYWSYTGTNSSRLRFFRSAVTEP